MLELSVLMTAYNAEEFISDAIDSILNQTYKNFEFIIVNDGSTDRTKEIIESYRDGRIRVFNLKNNLGVGAASNFGLSKAKGKYVARADADDISMPSRLEEQVRYLEENQDIDLVGSFMKYFAHDKEVENSTRYKHYKCIVEKQLNKVVSCREMQEKLYWYCALNHPNMLGRAEVIRKIGYIDVQIGEDYNLFYNLNKLDHKMSNLSKVLVLMRVSKCSLTTKKQTLFFRKTLFDIKRDEIVPLFGEYKQVYIWGAGKMGQDLVVALRRNNLSASGFVDSDKAKQNKFINGLMVHSPNVLSDTDGNSKVIVASGPGKFEIVDILKKMSYRHLEDFVVYY